MDGRALTGRDAAEALGLCMRLGAAGARFDRRRLDQALRSRAGRGRILGALLVAVRRPVRLALAPRPRRRAPRRLTLRAPLAAGAAPGRPRLGAAV